jgi:hypothetical protein
MAEYKDARTFVVSWINLEEKVLFSQQVKALHEWHAIELSNQNIFDPNDLHLIMSKEELYDEAFERDSMIEVLEIKNGNV